MRQVVLTIAVLQSAAMSADFRVADFGESCAEIVALETAIGSNSIPWQPNAEALQGALIAFEAEAFGRQVSIVYYCPKGKLKTGNYFFPTQSAADALQTFRATYDALKSIYGPTYLDNTPWQSGGLEFSPSRIAKDPSRYYVAWHTRDVLVTAVLRIEGDDPTTPNWRTFVVARPPIRTESNNSLERSREP